MEENWFVSPSGIGGNTTRFRREIFSTLASIQASSKLNSSSLANSSSMLLYRSFSSSSSNRPPFFRLPFTSFEILESRTGEDDAPSEGGGGGGGGKQSSSRPNSFVLKFSFRKSSFIAFRESRWWFPFAHVGEASDTIGALPRWFYCVSDDEAASCRPILRGMSLRNDAWPRDGECYPVWAHARTPPPRSLDRGCPGNAKSLQDSMNNQRERVGGSFDSKLKFFWSWRIWNSVVSHLVIW